MYIRISKIPSNTKNEIYQFFDSAYLLKNVRNNLFYSRRFIFLHLDLMNTVKLERSGVNLKIIASANLKKAYIITFELLYPGDNKLNMSLYPGDNKLNMSLYPRDNKLNMSLYPGDNKLNMSLYPRDNKLNMSLVLAVFHPTT